MHLYSGFRSRRQGQYQPVRARPSRTAATSCASGFNVIFIKHLPLEILLRWHRTKHVRCLILLYRESTGFSSECTTFLRIRLFFRQKVAGSPDCVLKMCKLCDILVITLLRQHAGTPIYPDTAPERTGVRIWNLPIQRNTGAGLNRS